MAAGPWVVGLVGVAMPGLRRAAATLSARYRGDSADLQTEILTGFLAAMRGLDPDDLTASGWRPGCAGPRGGPGRPSPYTDASYAAGRRDLPDGYDAPYMPWGHPDFVLAAAVTRGVLTPAQARLIGRNRLEGIPLAQIAAEMGISHSALCNRRKRAEKAITAAIRAGQGRKAALGWGQARSPAIATPAGYGDVTGQESTVSHVTRTPRW